MNNLLTFLSQTCRIWLPLTSAVAIFSPLLNSTAQAAPRTICYEMKFRDERFDCPTIGTTGAKRACDPTGDYSNPVGLAIQLWDRDSGDGSGDEFIGTWIIGGTGSRCITFEWENATYAGGEPDPDLYFVASNTVHHTNPSLGASVTGVRDNGSAYAATTWRGVMESTNCANGTTCGLGGIMLVGTDPASDFGQMFQMIDSAQRVLETYGDVFDVLAIQARYPGMGCPTGSSLSRTEFCMPTGTGSEGDRTAHEMGHVLQMHEFNQDTLRDSCGIDGWTMGTEQQESDSCATTEGWAAYVGAAAWYDPSNTSVAPLYGGQNVETAALAQAICGNNRRVPRQVAKAFWDLDDSNNEAGAGAASAWVDSSSLTTTSMANQWGNFPDGTGNHDDFESDADGVNLWDYQFNSGVNPGTLLDHNCLTSQTTG